MDQTERNYSIRRYYSDGRASELVKEDLTEEEAKEHCSWDDTEGRMPDGVEWFDAFKKD